MSLLYNKQKGQTVRSKDYKEGLLSATRELHTWTSTALFFPTSNRHRRAMLLRMVMSFVVGSNHSRARFLLLTSSIASIFLFPGCGTTTHRLPPYEPPLARTEFQTVRTTAYTHTEADHLAYGNRNALGGTLRAASIPATPVGAFGAAVAPPFDARLSNDELTEVQPYGFQSRSMVRPRASAPVQMAPAYHATYGSAAADWSRWPVGTVFQLASTGQIYRVDDYGWALAGRNTLDLYQSTPRAMQAWGVRRESLHILRWGSRDESLRRLHNHQKYRHIRRMVLELEGHNRAAAKLE